jgi:dephospho-CoA kinase
MLRVALTGGIGTGKSVVLAWFADLGAPIISADDVAHDVIGAGTPGAAAVRARFGAEVMRADGGVDRLRLAAIVFRDRDARRDLEAIVHPAVRAAISAWSEARARDGAAISVAEIPLLFENGREKDFDRVVVTACEEEEQVRRVAARSGLAADDVRRRIAAQMPLAEKARRAHYVIRTDGSIDGARQRAVEVWQQLQRDAAGFPA